jgi:hypothetical protein
VDTHQAGQITPEQSRGGVEFPQSGQHLPGGMGPTLKIEDENSLMLQMYTYVCIDTHQARQITPEQSGGTGSRGLLQENVCQKNRVVASHRMEGAWREPGIYTQFTSMNSTCRSDDDKESHSNGQGQKFGVHHGF